LPRRRSCRRFFPVLSLAAQDAKRPLKHSDFDAWRTIGPPLVSRDGHWAAHLKGAKPEDKKSAEAMPALASRWTRRK